VLFASVAIGKGQQAKKVPLIGYLSSNDAASESACAEAIRLALRERGYINLQAAKQIGLTIPPNVLVRATRVIK
jgi:hypothetical protein